MFIYISMYNVEGDPDLIAEELQSLPGVPLTFSSPTYLMQYGVLPQLAS